MWLGQADHAETLPADANEATRIATMTVSWKVFFAMYSPLCCLVER
jgi:hypothetical protein